jgi:hypothetical protein
MTATIDFKNIPSCGLDLHAVGSQIRCAVNSALVKA